LVADDALPRLDVEFVGEAEQGLVVLGVGLVEDVAVVDLDAAEDRALLLELGVGGEGRFAFGWRRGRLGGVGGAWRCLWLRRGQWQVPLLGRWRARCGPASGR
jgi:hypothetical protein